MSIERRALHPMMIPMTADCYCGHQYIGHVSLEFTNDSLECLVDDCECRRFKWTSKDRKRFMEAHADA
jgi:hypothetical protein